MRWSKFFAPTEKEEPSEALNISHKLLVKAGMMRLLTSGVYSYLPLGWKVLKKISEIIREEMNAIGAQEFLLPVLSPVEIWNETGRLSDAGELMFRLQDRKQRELCLSPTHEEIICDIARKSVKSYRDLPQIWYQIQTKFRDELRPRSGILRAREFLMKDSYSLGASKKELDESYELHRKAYKRILKRCGLKFIIVKAFSGLMGGSESEEFMVPVEAGEDNLIICDSCGYSANIDVATSFRENMSYPDGELLKVATPGKRTVEEVSTFLKVKPDRLIKSLLYKAKDSFVFALIMGDDELSESLLTLVLGAEWRAALPSEVVEICGASAGYISPVGLKGIRVIADPTLIDASGMVSGANEEDFHYMNINVKRDIKVDEFVSLRRVKDREGCPECKKQMRLVKAIEIGHIFKLGLKYSKAMGANFLDSDGVEKPIVMGSYGIGLGRILASAIEQDGGWDEEGICWSFSIAPFSVLVLPLYSENSSDIMSLSEKIYQSLKEKNIDVLLDDRDERPGYKFKDADLIGIPLRIVIGKEYMQSGKVEIKLRKKKDVEIVNPSSVVSRVQSIIEEEKKAIQD